MLDGFKARPRYFIPADKSKYPEGVPKQISTAKYAKYAKGKFCFGIVRVFRVVRGSIGGEGAINLFRRRGDADAMDERGGYKFQLRDTVCCQSNFFDKPNVRLNICPRDTVLARHRTDCFLGHMRNFSPDRNYCIKATRSRRVVIAAPFPIIFKSLF